MYGDGRTVVLPALGARVYRWVYDKTGWHLRPVPQADIPPLVGMAGPLTPSPCTEWNAAQVTKALAERGIDATPLGMVDKEENDGTV